MVLRSKALRIALSKNFWHKDTLTYCAGDGDAINSWMRSIFHATRLGIPVWIFGYSTKRVPDIATFRKQYIIDFGIMKERLIQFASNLWRIYW